MIYIIVLIALIVLSYQYDYLKKNKHKQLWYYIMLILFILIAGLRYRIGVDSIRYDRGFAFYPSLCNLAADDFIYSSYQPLYILLTAIARSFSDEFWMLQLLHSVLVNVVVFRFFRLNTKNVFLSILLYFIFLYSSYLFEVMRESSAVCMLLLGWEFFKKDEWIIFTIFIFLATLFHISALPLLILPVLRLFKVWSHLDVNKYTILYLVVIYIVGSIIQRVFFDYIIQLNLIESVTDKANRYVDSDLAGSQLNIFGIIENCIRQILFPFLGCLILKKQNSLDKNVESMLIICFSFIVLSFSISLAYRYNNYLYPFALIVMADAIYSKKIFCYKKSYIRLKSFNSWLAIIAIIAIIQIRGCYLVPIRNTSYKDYMRYYPYANIITKKVDNNREALFVLYNAE